MPVGAYSYSGGLEAAIEVGLVRDAASAQGWIGDVLEHTLARMEAPLLLRMIEHPDPAWNELLLAGRETAELRAETLQMGYSLAALLRNLGLEAIEDAEISFPLAYAHAVRCWRLEARESLVVYLWAWLENQVMAALKAVPLGQTDGQRILLALGARLEALAARAARLRDDELGNFAPRLAILSSRHETQYSRLFRS
ncbi:MAG: urease accessory protein UreF [Burkholderiales bacterium]